MADNFVAWDWVVFGLTIVISLAIGVFHAFFRGGQKTTSQFLIADHSMSMLPVAASMTVTFLSATVIMGNAAEAHYHGITYWFNIAGIFIAVCISTFIFVPLLYPLKLTSINEYLYLRYNSRWCVLMSLFCQVMNHLAINGISLFGVALVMKTMTDLETHITTIVCGIVATVYCTIGGFKAVVWTDTFQALVILGGILAVVIQGTLEVGSPSKIWELYDDGGRTEIETSMDPFVRLSVFALTIAYGIQWAIVLGFNQNAVQRYSCMKDLKTAKTAAFMVFPGQAILGSLAILAGIVTYGYYADKGCDPKANFRIFSPNQIAPYFVIDVLDYPAVPGLFTACLFAGCLSTVSSLLSANVTLIWQDIFVGFDIGQKFSERKKTFFTQLMMIFFGGLSILIGWLVERIGGTFIEITVLIISGFNVPFALLIFTGAVSPRINWASALTASITGAAFTLWVSMGQIELDAPNPTLPLVTTNCTWPPGFVPPFMRNMTIPEVEYTGLDKLYTISPFWITLLGLGVGLVCGIVSTAIPGFYSKERVPAKYLLNITHWFCSYYDDEDENSEEGSPKNRFELNGKVGSVSTVEEDMQEYM